MSDNYLSTDEVNSLGENLKASPETAYNNIGVNLGNGVVEIFKTENYNKLLSYILSSPELNSGNPEGAKLKSLLEKTISDLDVKGASQDLKLGKLCSFYVLVRRKNLSSWFFYKIPSQYQINGLVNYTLVPEKNNRTSSTPDVLFFQNSSNLSERKSDFTPNRNSGGRGGGRNQGGRGRGGGRNQGGRENVGSDRKSQHKDEEREVQISLEPIKPLFGELASRINSFESVKQTMIKSPELKPNNLELFASEKNQILDIIKQSMENKPSYKILCNKKTGILTLEKIDPDEYFDISTFNYCPFHSGKNPNSFGPISESIRKKITGAYGYMSDRSDCYDLCYMLETSSMPDEETSEIESQRKSINNVLISIEKLISDFNAAVANKKDLEKEEFLKKQSEYIYTIEMMSELGDNYERNIQLLQNIISDPLFQKQKRTVRQGRVQSIDYFFPELSIMDHSSFNSFFSNLPSIVSEFEKVDIKISLMGQDISSISSSITSQIIKVLPEVKNEIQKISCEVYPVGSNIFVKLIGTSISFQLNNFDTNRIVSNSTDSGNITDFERTIQTAIIIPKYEKGSYRDAIYNIGVSLLKSLDVYELLKEKYSVILLVGSCYISEYSNILSNLSIDGNNYYRIVKSDVNSFEISLDQITNTLNSLKKEISKVNNSGTVTFKLADLYDLEVNIDVAKNIVRQIEVLPEIKNGNFILYGSQEYHVSPEELSDFLKTIQNNLDSLSNKAKRDPKTNLLNSDNLSQIDTSTYASKIGVSNENSWEEVKSLKLESLSGISVKTKQSARKKQNKKDNSKSEISETIGTITTKDSENDIFNKEYDTRYFDEEFEVGGYLISGFEALTLLEEYFSLSNFNSDTNSIRITIQSVPIKRTNMVYLYSVLFPEDEELIATMFDEDGNLVNDKYSILTLLFGSSCRYFEIQKDNRFELVKLKSELSRTNPLYTNKRNNFSIHSSDARKAKILNKCMESMEKIYRIAISSKLSAIKTLGEEIISSVFTGFQDTHQGVCFENKNAVIPIAGNIIERRLALRSFFIEKVKPFFERIHYQDTIGNVISYYDSVSNYIVFSSSKESRYEPDLVVPSNPYYWTNYTPDQKIEPLFEPEFSIYVNDSMKTESINSIIPSDEVITLMNLLFPQKDCVQLELVFPQFQVILSETKLQNHLITLSLLNRYKDLIFTNKKVFTEGEFGKIEEIFENVERLFGAIEIKFLAANKSKDNLPSISELPNFISLLISQLKNILKDKSFSGMNFDPSKGLDIFILSFKDILPLFNHRRKQMRNYVKEMVSHFFDVKGSSNGVFEVLKFESFVNIDQSVSDSGQPFQVDSDKIDVIEKGMEKVVIMIDTFNKGKINSELRLSELTMNIDLDTKSKIFNKFSKILLSSNTQTSYNTICNSICYFLYSNLGKKIYDTYCTINYGPILQSVSKTAVNVFKENQEKIFTECEKARTMKEKRIENLSKIAIISNKIKEIDDNIASKKNDLIVKFIEYVSTIDVLIKSYENRKKSYGSDDFSFKEMIDNMKLRLDSIKKSYEKVDNLEMNIILSIFTDNFELYSIRKECYREFKYTPDTLEEFNRTINSSVEYVKIYAKMSRNDQIKTLNDKLTKYFLKVTSPVSSLENSIRTLPLDEQNEIKKEFIKCRFAFKIFEMMRNESQNIEYRLCNNKIPNINIPKRDDQPKFDSYGSELNESFDGILVDRYTFNDCQILGRNISQFIESVQNGLRVIDSGPGLHLLSDAIDSFLLLLNSYENPDVSKIFTSFIESMGKFNHFITSCGKSVNDIVQSSDFKLFVSTINGKFSTFSSITGSINYFDETGNAFPVYDSITDDFVRGLLLTLNEIFVSRTFVDMDSILFKFSSNCDSKYTYDNLSELFNNISEFNSAIINFIDEYQDENGRILNDLEVIEYRKDYNLKTKGEFMSNMFRKLNYCVRLYVNQQKEDFRNKTIERFIVYLEAFSKKFKSLKNLEKYMLNR